MKKIQVKTLTPITFSQNRRRMRWPISAVQREAASVGSGRRFMQATLR